MDDEEEEEDFDDEEEEEEVVMAEEEEVDDEPLFGPDPSKDTPAQRQLRREAARVEREREYAAMPNIGFGGSEGMGALNDLEGDWMHEILEQMGDADAVAEDQKLVDMRFIGNDAHESFALDFERRAVGAMDGGGEDAAMDEEEEEEEPDFTEPSTEYKKREMKGMLRCLSMMICQFASEVEGEYILGGRDAPGKPAAMAPVKFKFAQQH